MKSAHTPDPTNALKNSLQEMIIVKGQAQKLDLNLGRTNVTTAQIEEALRTMIDDRFDGDLGRFEDWWSYTRDDGTKFSIQEIVVFEDGVQTKIWPLG